MKILIQWTTNPARGWVEMDSSQWSTLPKKPLPVGGEIIDNTPGWIYAINCQGVIFSGDHYCVKDLRGGGVEIITWTDDLDDRPEDEFYSLNAFLIPPGYDGDPSVKKINTRQQYNIYANKKIADLLAEGVCSNRQMLGSFKDFIPPSDELVRHGINVPDNLSEGHKKIVTIRGWREWIK